MHYQRLDGDDGPYGFRPMNPLYWGAGMHVSLFYYTRLNFASVICARREKTVRNWLW